MRVEELMSRSVFSCRPEDTLDKAAKQMWENDFGVVPVCEGNGETRLIGVITDRDICMSAYFQGKPLHEIRVSQAMTREVRVCHPEDAAADAERTMRGAQVRRLPVVSAAGELIGIISLADIAREAAREAADSRKSPEITEVEVGDTLAAIVERSRQLAETGGGASRPSAS